MKVPVRGSKLALVLNCSVSMRLPFSRILSMACCRSSVSSHLFSEISQQSSCSSKMFCCTTDLSRSTSTFLWRMALDRSAATSCRCSGVREGKQVVVSSMKTPSGRVTRAPQYRQLPSPSCAQTTLPQLRQLLTSSCFCPMQSHFSLCMQISFGRAFSFFINIILQQLLNQLPDLSHPAGREARRGGEVVVGNGLVGGSIQQIIMRQGRGKNEGVKLPQIRDRLNLPGSGSINKSLKLEKINRHKHIALINISKINNIEKEYAQITRRGQDEGDHRVPSRDEMRESKLLLLKGISPQAPKRSNLNLLSSLVEYGAPKLKRAVINSNNLSVSPSKARKPERRQQSEKNMAAQYKQPGELLKVDFVKLFIVEELLFYISKTNERVKEEMAGFCKFYIENSDEESYALVGSVLTRHGDYLNALFLEKLGFYVFLILGTDAEIQEEAHYLLNSLTDYIHTNNLIILDLLMEIVDIEKFPISSQFHVYNTLRFNEDRRKIRHGEDKMNLVAKNNASLVEIIRSIVLNCGFESLRTFVFEILNSTDSELLDKVREVSLMLVSLDSILTSSLHQVPAKPLPPFLPAIQGSKPYTLVLDMDETLIHTKEIQRTKSLFVIRPFCQQFLDEVSKHYEVVIFTAAVKEYADQILDSIDEKKRISHRLYREHTRIEDYVSIKDLGMIGRDLSKAIIIDNIASNFKLQPRNGIAISTWTGELEDISLYNLIPVLKKLAVEGVKDVRDGLQRLSEFMEMRMSKGQAIVFDDISLKGL